MGRRTGDRRRGRGGGGLGGGGTFVPATPALDGLPTLGAAWSVNERLLTAYTGPLFRIRRASDNAELDITTAGATIYVDQAAIAAHCGASVGSVVAVYDQSGGVSRDVTQVTAGLQPQIYNGTAVVKSGSNVGMTYLTNTAVLTRADSCGLTGSPDFSVAALSAIPSGAFRGLYSFGDGGVTAFQDTYCTINSLVPNIGSFSSNAFYTAVASAAYHYDVVQHAAGLSIASFVVRQNGAPSPYTSGPATAINLTSALTEVGNVHASNGLRGTLSTLVLFPYLLTAPLLATVEAWLESRRTA
jgi:hypothetical protein